MIRISQSVRVALAGTAAVATIAAGAGALVASSAVAAVGDATTLQIEPVYPSGNAASAGTCMIYRAVPKTGLGAVASDSGTVIITLKENPNSTTQDVDFCLPPTAAQRPSGAQGAESGSAAVVDHGYYLNSPNGAGATPANASRQYYCAGESITPGSATAPSCGKPANAGAGTASNPDTSSNASLTTNPFVGADTNPAGTDYVDDVRYNHDTSGGQSVADFIEFGVAGLIPGGATIDACIDRSSSGKGNGSCADTGDISASQVAVTFTAGGAPDSVPAYDAVTSISTDRSAYSAVQSTGTSASVAGTLLNSSSDTVFGVVPNFRVQSGPNASSAIRSCSRSSDFGRFTCNYSGTNVGTDSLLIWVNHSAPSSGAATSGPDPGEPTATVTVTTYAQPASAASARTIDLTPNAPTSTTAGQSKDFTASVTDAAGTPAQAVNVSFSESGPGQIQFGSSPNGITSSRVVQTGPDGRATITITTQAGESGSETVTAAIDPNTTQCASVFNGQSGTCSDSTTNTIGGAPSPSPSASTVASASPSASGSASASASPSASSSSSSPAGTRQTLVLRINTPTVPAGSRASVTVTGAANQIIQLVCYSRPSTTYSVVRQTTSNAAGDPVTFSDLALGRNTRCYAQYATNSTQGAAPSQVISVTTVVSLSAVRTGVRTYTFQGRNLPRAAGQLITLYRIDGNGNEIRTANLKTDASGIYRLSRHFTGGGTFSFIARTGATLNNIAGHSNVYSVNIH